MADDHLIWTLLAALPIEEVTTSSHVMLAVTAGGGHLGWFDGPLFAGTKTIKTADGKIERVRAYPQQRWIAKPVQEFITAIVDELDYEATGYTNQPVFENKEDDWVWVKGSEKQVYGPVGWKVVESGGAVQGNNESGVLAGL